MISIIYSTRKHDQNFIDHLRSTCGLKNIQILTYINNGEYSLTEIYNKGLKESTNDIVIFCHDDIKFNRPKWGKKIITHFDKSDYGILGIAGTTDVPISGKWWEDTTKMVGIVKHTHEGKTWESKYSGNFQDRIIETAILDGLFFAVNKNRIRRKFNENIRGFHFYDIDFTFTNHLEKVKVGVIFNVKITHFSIGETNIEWDKNRLYFSELHQDVLPYNLKVKILWEDTHITLKHQPSIGIIIPTKGNVDLLLGCVNSIYEKDNYSNIIIYIADTGSTPEEIIEITEFIDSHTIQFGHKIQLIQYDYYNFAKINNDVVNNYVSEDIQLLLFCNNDIKLINNAITRLVNVYIKNKNTVGTLGGRLHFENGTIQHSGMTLFLKQNNKTQYNIGLTHHGLNSYYNYHSSTQPVLGNTGAFLLINKKLFNNIKQFNENYLECFEDVELNLECLKRNKKNIFIEDAVCYHYESKTRNKNDEKLKRESMDYKKLIPVIIDNPKTYDYFSNVKSHILKQIFNHVKTIN